MCIIQSFICIKHTESSIIFMLFKTLLPYIQFTSKNVLEKNLEQIS